MFLIVLEPTHSNRRVLTLRKNNIFYNAVKNDTKYKDNASSSSAQKGPRTCARL